MLLLVNGVSAQRNPTMPGQMDDAEREQLYTRFSENKKIPIPEKQRLAYEAGKEYLSRFNESSGDRYIPEIRRFVTEYEKANRQHELRTLYAAKNYAKVFEVGRSILANDPDNFYVLSVLSEAAFDESRLGKSDNGNDVADYTRRAIALLESDKLTKTDPFASKEVGRSYLNFALGWFLRTSLRLSSRCACHCGDNRRPLQKQRSDLQLAWKHDSERRLPKTFGGVQREVR